MSRWIASRVSTMPRVGSRLSLEQAESVGARCIRVLKTSGTPHTPPPHVLEAASRAARSNGTAPPQGLPELRQAIAAKLQRDNNPVVDPAEDVLVTTGAQQGLFLTLMGTLEPSDEIIVPTPSYFVDGLIAMTGAPPIFVPLDAATGYALDVPRLERAVTLRTKAVLVVNLRNPGSHVATGDELLALGELAMRHDLLLIVDESYERVVFDGRTHRSLGALPGSSAPPPDRVTPCRRIFRRRGSRTISRPASRSI